MPARPPDLSSIQSDQAADWRTKSLCRNSFTSYPFFAVEMEDKQTKRQREYEAKRICSNCSVKKECLNFALRERIPYGIWGGITEEERRQMLKSNDRIVKHKAPQAS